jgi:hypothetical protein
MINPFRDYIRVVREEIETRRNPADGVRQFSTLRLNEPTPEELRDELRTIEKVYSMGDKLYKYSYEIYGSTEYWWVIAWFNNKPTDTHCKIGDVISIPIPLERAIVIATREK